MAEESTKIGDLPALRALADPLRMRILDLVGDEARSVKELAAALDVPRTRLHYHVNVLEKHGIIQVASTRVVNGAVERRYEPTGRRFEARHLPMPPAVAAGIAGLLAQAAEDVGARLQRKDSRTAVGRGHVQLTEAQHVELVERLQDLLDEYSENDDPDATEAIMVFALYQQ
jgi:DNA-binding transcriptional ArsR family regulator